MLAPVTAVVLNTSPVAEGQTAVGPVRMVGAEGKTVKTSVRAVLAPQALLATTERVPLVNPLAGTTRLMEVPVLLPEILQPAGAVQV